MKFIFLILLFASLANAKTCGEISQITGKVHVLRTNTNEDLNRIALAVQIPFQLWCTDIVVTEAGSRAKVTLPNGIITMSPNSRIFVEKVIRGTSTPSLLNLTYGKIRTFFDGKKSEQNTTGKDSQSQFRVKTPSAVVGVRGTDFYVSFDPNKAETTQATLKGEVEVARVEKLDDKVIVKSGEEVKVDEIKAEKTATPLAPLKVESVEKDTVMQIRQTSPLVKEEKDFNSPEAVKILGPSDKWVPPADEIPGDLKDIKNVF